MSQRDETKKRLLALGISEDTLAGELYWNLDEARLKGADLSRASLSHVYFKKARLQGADLSGAYLDHAFLLEAKLEGANLRDAVLTNADLSGADLTNADLRGAFVAGARLTGIPIMPTSLTGPEMTVERLRRARETMPVTMTPIRVTPRQLAQVFYLEWAFLDSGVYDAALAAGYQPCPPGVTPAIHVAMMRKRRVFE
ncbi:MAG: pentapeptide repeat-containing protein [Candidatus Magasanikbacteria bacterium]|nr:pentapeptide repeat-containing protein [Candidatus Magasanikbacteria bacterium]